MKRIWASLAQSPALQRILTHSGWLLASSGFTAILGLVQGIIIARAIGVRDYGVLAVILTYSAAVLQLFDWRVWEAIIKFMAEYLQRKETGKALALIKLAFVAESVSAVLAFGVVAVTAGSVAEWLTKRPADAELVRIYAVVGVISIPINPCIGILRAAARFDLLAVQNGVVAVAKTAALLVVCEFGGGLREILGVHLAAAGLHSAAGCWMGRAVARTLNLSRGPRGWLRELKGQYGAILGFMVNTNLVGTSRLLTSKADVLILGGLGTPHAVGLYRLAKQVCDSFEGIFGPFCAAAYPEMNRLVLSRDAEHLTRLQRKLSILLLCIALPVAAAIALSAHVFIPALFGEPYAPAAALCAVMIWQLVWGVGLWVPGYLLALGRAGILTAMSWLEALAYVGLLVVLVGRFEARGASLATLLHFLIWTGLMLTVAVLARPSVALAKGRVEIDRVTG